MTESERRAADDRPDRREHGAEVGAAVAVPVGPLPHRGVDEQVARCDDVELLDLGLVRLGGAATCSGDGGTDLAAGAAHESEGDRGDDEAGQRPGHEAAAPDIAASLPPPLESPRLDGRRPLDAAVHVPLVARPSDGEFPESDRAGRVAPPTLEAEVATPERRYGPGAGITLGGIIVIVGILVLILWSTIWASSSSSSACSPSEVLRGAAGTDPQGADPGPDQTFRSPQTGVVHARVERLGEGGAP